MEVMKKRGFCQLLLITALLVGSATLFFVIGALGPPSSRVTYHHFHTCVVPSAGGHIWDPTYELINDESCNKIGRHLEMEAKATLKDYPLQNILFYTQIPYIKDHVMSRLFQHLITDLGIQFSSTDYIRRLMGNVAVPCIVTLSSRSLPFAVRISGKQWGLLLKVGGGKLIVPLPL